MIRMTERVSIRTRAYGRRTIRLLIVANATRRDLASCVRFACGRVTTVATVMGGQIRRNRQRDAAIGRHMTTVATLWGSSRAAHVLSVIEFHVEPLVESGGKVLQWWITAFCICVADHTHLNRRRCELPAVAVGAGFMTGKARCRGVVGTLVARVAGEGTVSLTRV